MTTSSAQVRRDQLVKVQEQLGDPDPLMRLGYMEEILASCDALRMQIAMRTAFASDDSDLRAIALRGYLTGHKEFMFDTMPPSAMQKAYEGRTQSNAIEVNRLYHFFSVLDSNLKRIRLELVSFNSWIKLKGHKAPLKQDLRLQMMLFLPYLISLIWALATSISRRHPGNLWRGTFLVQTGLSWPL